MKTLAQNEVDSIQGFNGWAEIGADWPDPIQFRRLSNLRPEFPLSPGYVRNLITGAERDPILSKSVFYIGRFPTIRKNDLISWLDKRTRAASPKG